MKLNTFKSILLLAILMLGCPSNSSAKDLSKTLIAQSVPTAPTFDMLSAVYTSPTYLEMSSQSGTTIYFTTDGTQPNTTNSLTYTGPLFPASTTIYNAIAVDGSGNQSPVSTVYMLYDAAARGFSSSNRNLWLKSYFALVSSASKVSRWVDLSGHGNGDTVQATVANQPTVVDSQLNSYPAVNFQSGQFLQMPVQGFDNFTGGGTFLFVLRPTSLSAGATIVDIGNGAASDNINFTETSSTGGIQFSIYNGSTASSISATNVLTPNQFQLFSINFDGDHTATLFKNGVQIAQNTSMQTPNNLTRSQNFIGQASAGGNFFQGQICEVMLYTSSQPTSDRFAAESYLMTKYQINHQTPKAPLFNLASATFTKPSQVVLSTSSDSKMFWTSDGSEPDSSKNPYSQPINISFTQTIKAVAISKLTGNSSPVSTATFTLDSTLWPAPSTGGSPLLINITSPSTSIPQ